MHYDFDACTSSLQLSSAKIHSLDNVQEVVPLALL